MNIHFQKLNFKIKYFKIYLNKEEFPGGSEDKASACHVGDPGLIPGLGRSPGEGNGNPLQYSCLENPMDRGVWRATVHGVAKSWTRLSEFNSAFEPWDLFCGLDFYVWHNLR